MGLNLSLLSEILGAECRDLRRLPGGASRETWSFTADGRPLILRRDPPGALRAGISLTIETELLRAAWKAGVPVPQIVAAGEELDGGPYMIVEQIDGETIPRRILRDLTPQTGTRTIDQCGEALARIHAIAPDESLELREHDPIEWCRGVLDEWKRPQPALEIGLRWLAERRPPLAEPAVVHGDFRNGNLIIGSDGLRAVLDWELAHLGDPMEDLGWMCVRAWRFGSPMRAGGFGTAEQLAAAYERAGGGTVDPDILRWWEVMGTVRWGAICILQVTTHLSGRQRSVELAAIGRRVCEVEHDVLTLVS